MYSINFTLTKKRFCLILHYNGTSSYLFVNGTEIYKFKSKDWSVDNMKRTGFTGYVHDFSVGYIGIKVDNIKDIHKYLMKKNDIV